MRNSFLTYHPALWAPLLQLEEGNLDTPTINIEKKVRVRPPYPHSPRTNSRP